MRKNLAKSVLPRQLLEQIALQLAPMIRVRKNQEPAARKTRENKRLFYNRMFAELWMLGYKIQRASNFAPRHVEALMKSWSDKGLSIGELHGRLSAMNILLEYLGKGDHVKRVQDYFPDRDMTRVQIAQENRSWEARDVDAEEIIEKAREKEERFACILALQHRFGLRAKEAIEMRPERAYSDGGGDAILVIEGTKGGRPRIVPITTEAQRKTIEWACELACRTKSGRMRWPGDSWVKSQAKYYYRCNAWLGITKKELGVTPHGLRHEFAQTVYRRKTGKPTPIEGGALGQIRREEHAEASRVVSQQLGHGRIDVAGTYYGSYGHKLRTSNGGYGQTPAFYVYTPVVNVRVGQ